MFIATYAGRVSCVVFSSPLGLPSDSTQCSPTKSRDSKLEIRFSKIFTALVSGNSAPHLNQFVEASSRLVILFFKSGVNFFGEISEIAGRVQNDIDLTRKRLKSAGDRFLP